MLIPRPITGKGNVSTVINSDLSFHHRGLERSLLLSAGILANVNKVSLSIINRAYALYTKR